MSTPLVVICSCKLAQKITILTCPRMWLHLIRNDNASLEELVHAFRQSLHWWITEKFQSIQLLHLVDEKWPNVAHLVLILQTLWYIWKQGKSFSWVEKNTFFFINVTNDNDFVGQYLHDQRYRSRGVGSRSFNPIQTRGADYPHHITTAPPLRFLDLAASLHTYFPLGSTESSK